MQNLESNNYAAPLPKENIINALPPSPDNPPWGWITAALVWLTSILLLLIVPTVILIPYAHSRGISIGDGQALKDFLLNDYTAVLLQIGLVIPIHAVTLALSWAVVTKFNKFSFRETLGWKWGYSKWWQIALMLVGYVFIIIAFFALAYLLTRVFGEQDNDLLRILRSSRAAVYIIAFLATFTAPIVEEVIYRGILYSAFQRKFGVPITIFIVSLLFAGVHFFQYSGDATAIIMICLLSMTLTLIRFKTGNLLPCIVLHTIFNGIQSVGLIAEPFFSGKSNQEAAVFHSIIFHFIK